jgi:hypothetical protein
MRTGGHRERKAHARPQEELALHRRQAGHRFNPESVRRVLAR